MRRIQSAINTSSPEFRTRYAHNTKLVETFREKQNTARYTRPERDLNRLARQGKMLPRERVERLLDPGTPFLELSSLAGNMDYDGEAPGASIITGLGIVSGREVLIHADDPTIMSLFRAQAQCFWAVPRWSRPQRVKKLALRN